MNDNYDERDDELLAMASRLSTEVAPERDLWPGIEAGIAPPQRTRWSPLFAQAAAVVLLVAGSSGVTYLAVTDKYESNQPVLTQPVLPNMLFEETSFGGKYTLGSGFQDARGNLASKLDQELARLSPESRADVEMNMQVIRDAIDEINVALEAEPENILLQELLLRAYRDELRMMRKIGGLTKNVMMRNDI
jgi:hypothetical protein